MYEELKSLFGKATPSVRRFEKLLEELPPERQYYYHELAYRAAFCDWKGMNMRYKTFLIHLFMHDRQQTLNFLLSGTILGSLQYQLREPDIVLRLMGQMEHVPNGFQVSMNHLAFCLLLVFSLTWSVNYLSDKLCSQILRAEDLLRLQEETLIYPEAGHISLSSVKES